MTLTIAPAEMALRLLATLAACALIGLNRSERGEAAGLRTTMLVGLASALSMILANLWLATAGRTPEMFASIDLMRLPLGVLTGMGFIGGGAILRRGSVVQGVTTAATLWTVTALGLCFGGGEIVLGGVATVLSMGILRVLKPVENQLKRHRQGKLALRIGPEGPTPDAVLNHLTQGGVEIHVWDVARAHGIATIRAEFQWVARGIDNRPPASVANLAEFPGVRAIRWSTR